MCAEVTGCCTDGTDNDTFKQCFDTSISDKGVELPDVSGLMAGAGGPAEPTTNDEVEEPATNDEVVEPATNDEVVEPATNDEVSDPEPAPAAEDPVEEPAAPSSARILDVSSALSCIVLLYSAALISSV